jgi:cytochrome c5
LTGGTIMGAEHASCNLSAQNRLRAARARAFANGSRADQLDAPAPAPERRYSRHWNGSEVYEAWCSECRKLGAACGKLIVREC